MQGVETVKIYRQMAQVARLARQAYGPYKKEILFLTILGFIGGILEGIGINAVIPLLTSVLGLQNPATDMLSVAIKSFFELINVPFVPRYLLGFIVILFITKSAVTLLLSYIQILITNEYERETRSTVFALILRTSWPHLLKQKLGNLETVLMVDVPASVGMLSKIAFAITLLTSLTMYLAVAFSISTPVTLSTMGLGVIVFVSLRPLFDRVHSISRSRTIAYRDTMHSASEHMSGMKTIKAFGVEDRAIAKGNELYSEIKGLTTRLGVIQSIATQAIAPVGVIYIAVILSMAFKTPFISFAALPAMLYLIYRIFSYIQQLQGIVQEFSVLTPHLERLLQYENDARKEHESTHGQLPFSFQKEFRFNAVSFAYESSPSGVLKDVSFTVKKGDMLGIVGPSGAGKTTCVDLMLRLLTPSSGSVLVDGVNGNDIRMHDWRRRISYVSQDFFLLHDSIRNNIRFYDDSITDEDIWKAAEMAHIDDFIKDCPEGLDTQVGDRGVRLSAGQRQRIVIARAIARNPDILILDEATSSLDAESEAHIKRVIDTLKGRITIVAIAHRLSTIMGSDQLVVLQSGQVVETGSPKELLGNQDSYFYKVYTITQ